MNIKIENCYGITQKDINALIKLTGIGQFIGIIPETYKMGPIYINGYYNKKDSNNPFIYMNEREGDTQITIVDVDGFNIQEFCDILNNWVNSNNIDGKYSKWKYDTNRNGGYPYLECFEQLV